MRGMMAAVFFVAAMCGSLYASDYYVDDRGGDDARDGKSPSTAWRSLDRVNRAKLAGGDCVRFRRGGLWRGTLRPSSGSKNRPVVYTSYGTGAKPILQQSADRSRPEDWLQIGPSLWATQTNAANSLITVDVGNIIIDHGKRWGVKKWDNPEWKEPKGKRWKGASCLENDLDFWYEPKKLRVVVRYPTNPGEAFDSIELAMKNHIVNQGGRHDVTYDGLWIRYGAGHGFGGAPTENIVIRNCDVCWIGGGLQFWRKDKQTGKILYPARYGNGIEFWGRCQNCLVERCRLWEIYDAAVTNQGADDSETDVTWRDNVIWNSEYSYEYWNRGVTRNILFEHNTCVDAGCGWAHAQRHNPNGAHLMYYFNRAATTNFVVRNNIFCRATEWTIRSGLDWRYGLIHDNNLVYNEGNVPVLRWLEGKQRKLCTWSDYQALGFDKHGRLAEPRFRDPQKRDYRLCEDSAGRTLGVGGEAVGARNMPGLDEDQSATGLP